MKLSDIILENELERFSVSGQMKQTDNIVDQVAKAIAKEYDMKDDGMLRGTIRDAVITAKYDMDEEINEGDNFLIKLANEFAEKFPRLSFDLRFPGSKHRRIDVRGPQQDLLDFGNKYHGLQIGDYEIFHVDDDDRGEIVRIVRKDR